MDFYPVLISLVPGIEIRGAIVYSRLAGLGLIDGYLLPLIASMMIVPLVYLGIDIFFHWFMRFGLVSRTVSGIRRKVHKYVDRYGFLGLVIFVAIPLPGSGLYSGSLGAVLLGLDRRKAIPALYLGNILAFLLVCLMTLSI